MCACCTVAEDLNACQVTRPRSLSAVDAAAATRQRETSNHSAPASSSSSSRVVNNWTTRSPGHADDDVIRSRGCRGDVTPDAGADGQSVLIASFVYCRANKTKNSKKSRKMRISRCRIWRRLCGIPWDAYSHFVE